MLYNHPNSTIIEYHHWPGHSHKYHVHWQLELRMLARGQNVSSVDVDAYHTLDSAMATMLMLEVLEHFCAADSVPSI